MKNYLYFKLEFFITSLNIRIFYYEKKKLLKKKI